MLARDREHGDTQIHQVPGEDSTRPGTARNSIPADWPNSDRRPDRVHQRPGLGRWAYGSPVERRVADGGVEQKLDKTEVIRGSAPKGDATLSWIIPAELVTPGLRYQVSFLEGDANAAGGSEDGPSPSNCSDPRRLTISPTATPSGFRTTAGITHFRSSKP
jgi:hypothetical protein